MIRVITFGKFQITDDDRVMDEDVLRSDMLTRLLVYILIHRDHAIPIQELTDALWNDDETDNPAGALKNLMYRLRTQLKKHLGDKEYIQSGRGFYSWNNNLDMEVDLERFEKLCFDASCTTSIKKQKELYEEAIGLYQGDFVPKIGDRPWAVTTSTYYHSAYLDAVKQLAELYLEEGLDEDVVRICARGLDFDPVDEWLRYYIIKARIHENKIPQAQEVFERTKKILYENLGIRKSPMLTRMSDEILSVQRIGEAESLENAYQDMQEEEGPEGAYVCGYPVFKEMYRLESRKISRLGQSEYLLLVTLEFKPDAVSTNVELNKTMMEQAMSEMEVDLKAALRIGDVVARYSDTQYVVLLPTCTFENCEIIAERIQDSFYQNPKMKRMRYKADFEEVGSANSKQIMKKA